GGEKLIWPKRQAKPSADDGYWDCSVCTFRNSAEAFKCSICDVRKGTSTRYGVFLFTRPSWRFSPKREEKKENNKTMTRQTLNILPKLKNVDRSTAQQLAITVGNVTVIITDFKEKTRSSSTSSSTVTSSAGSEQQHQSSGSESMDKGSSRASTPKGDLSVGHDESF
uniref:RING1 and YY1 binding protein b n=1 Tax=Astyanax mexicanus TaxID=7994 RepID=A0A8B9JKV8_ASTMX